MRNQKRVLEALHKITLLEISKPLGLKRMAAFSKDDIIQKISRKKSIKLGDILSRLEITDLRIICSKLGLNLGSKNKQVLIDRIVGDYL